MGFAAGFAAGWGAVDSAMRQKMEEERQKRDDAFRQTEQDIIRARIAAALQK